MRLFKSHQTLKLYFLAERQFGQFTNLKNRERSLQCPTSKETQHLTAYRDKPEASVARYVAVKAENNN